MIRSLLILLTLTSCAGGSLRPDMPATSEARKACNFVLGKVISVQDVLIEADRESAQAAGATIGGYVGNRVSDGESDLEQTITTLAGAAIGNKIGDAVGQAKARPGINIFVELNGGTGISVVQEKIETPMVAGQEVLVSGYPRPRGYYNRDSACTLRVLPK